MLRTLWPRTKSFFVRLFQRKPPAPGRFEEGSQFSWRGLLAVAPWIWPRRDYLVYVPAGHSTWRRRPMLVLVHGCRQSAEDIAAGSRITALADALDCLVLLPKQSPRANAWGCWNWFDSRTAAGGGETAIVAAQIRAVRRRYRVHKKRVFAAGISSGAGLLAALTLRNSRLLAGVFLHSGIAAGAASSPVAAIGVVKSGPDTDVVRIALIARQRSGKTAHSVPVLVLHGSRDDVVAPVHANEIVRQMLAFAHFPGVEPAPAALPAPDRESSTDLSEGRGMITRDWHDGARLIARQVMVDGLGHAWSGGTESLPYNDSRPPDATALLRTFMADVLR